MIPSMKLRWFLPSTPTVTAEMVKAYSAANNVSFLHAERAIKGPPTAPVLQQWWDVEGWEHDDYMEAGGEWRDVELEVGNS